MISQILVQIIPVVAGDRDVIILPHLRVVVEQMQFGERQAIF